MIATVNRFALPSPLGFQAGDENLFRFVGNDPTNTVDPSGLQPPPPAPIGGSTGSISEPSPLLPHLFDPPAKDQILNGVPTRGRDDLPGGPNGGQIKRVGQDTWWAGKVPDGWLVDPQACGPCVGVILVPDKPTEKDTYAIHYSGADQVGQGLKKCGFMKKSVEYEMSLGGHRAWRKSEVYRAPAGYQAILCGCEANPSDKALDNGRLRTLRSVREALAGHGIPIEAYVPAPGVGVDRHGKPHWTTPSTVPVNKYEK